MKALIILVAVALTAGQQFQSRGQFNTAVRLAGQGFFQRGSRNFASTFDNNNNYNSNNNNQQQGSAFFSNANSLQSQNTRKIQNNDQFQSRNRAFQQSRLNSIDANNRNQQTSFSSGFSQGQNRDQFQSSQFESRSPQTNNEVKFGSSSNQQNSRNQFQTRNRVTPVNIQLTPSNRFQTTATHQISGTSFQTTENQQNSQFQQSNSNRQRFVSDSKAYSNIQFSSGNQFQSSTKSVNNFNNDATDGVFEPLNLPSGASRLLGSIDTSFSCVDRPYGYYADQENSCRLFHVCNPSLFSDGEIQIYQYSFMCGEGTIFDQNELTCKNEFDATPCQEASNYYFRNEHFGREDDRSF